MRLSRRELKLVYTVAVDLWAPSQKKNQIFVKNVLGNDISVTVDSQLKKGINFRVKSWEAIHANIKITLLFLRQFWIIGNFNQKLVIAILYSRGLIQNSEISELRTCVK